MAKAACHSTSDLDGGCRMNGKILGFFIACLCLVFLVPSVWPDEWVQDGGSLNGVLGVVKPQIVGNSTPYVAFQEINYYIKGTFGWTYSYQVKVKYFDGSNWLSTPGDNLGFFTSEMLDPGGYHKIRMQGNIPYVISYQNITDNVAIRVNRYNGSAWESLGFPANGYNANITFKDDVPYLAYRHDDDIVNVCHFNGSGWQPDGSYLNVSTTPSNGSTNPPQIIISNTLPYVIWDEQRYNGSLWELQLFLKHFDGSTWIQDDTALYLDPDHSDYLGVTFTASSGLYAGVVINNDWQYIKHHNGSNWELICSDTGKFTAANNTVYSAFTALSSTLQIELYVKKYNGIDWEQIGGRLNDEPIYSSSKVSVSTINNIPYVAFEAGSGIYVKHYDPNIVFTPTPTPTPTIAPRDSPNSFAYPNPAKDYVNFYLPENENANGVEIRIFNLAGECVYKSIQPVLSKSNKIITWNCSGVAAGIYFAQIKYNGKKELIKSAINR